RDSKSRGNRAFLSRFSAQLGDDQARGGHRRGGFPEEDSEEHENSLVRIAGFDESIGNRAAALSYALLSSKRPGNFVFPCASLGMAERSSAMKYDFLIETYETERVKVISAWSMFRDDDLPVRPNASDGRGRSLREHMVHQCVSEDLWFRTMLGIDVAAPPLPATETRVEFIRRYAEDSAKRLVVVQSRDE